MEPLTQQPGFARFWRAAADFLCLYSDEEHCEVCDAVATVFLLDMAPNLVRYLETIFTA